MNAAYVSFKKSDNVSAILLSCRTEAKSWGGGGGGGGGGASHIMNSMAS